MLRNRKKIVAAASAATLTSLGLYYVYQTKYRLNHLENLLKSRIEPPLLEYRIAKMTDDIFDTTDNLFVLMYQSESSREKLKSLEASIIDKVRSAAGEKFNLFYTFPLEQPNSNNMNNEVQIILYKGNRKLRDSISSELTNDQIAKYMSFFDPVSALKVPVNLQNQPEEMTLTSFKSDISREMSPVLVQLYEKTCFLCFLMRPLINSIHRSLQNEGMKISIKRLDVEENDFPDTLPVSRGTPTFIGCSTENDYIKVEKWKEFRPTEIIDRLSKQIEVSKKIEDYWRSLPGLLTERFRFFSQFVMWQTEQSLLERCLIISDANSTTYSEDKEMFNTQISAAMIDDAGRSDSLEENIKMLTKEIKSAEMDAILLGIQLSEKLLAR
jgi:thiol-disulfide isomerase/thioredoxin